MKISLKLSSAGVLLAASLAVMPALRASLPSTTSSNLTIVYPATAGTVTTGQNSNTLNITSTAPTTVLNWAHFWDYTTDGGNPNSGDTINYTLPSATASILNNVSSSSDRTYIRGAITSNGKVYLLNPNGITIDNGGSVNAAGFYASTVSENLSYFEQNGNLQVFSSTPPAAAPYNDIELNDVSIQTIGGGGDVKFAAEGITFYNNAVIHGNTYLTSTGSNINIYGGTFAATTVAGVTVGGNLTAVTPHGDAVLLNGNDDNIYVDGNLVINSYGGQVTLSNDSDVSVGGTTTVNTVGATSNGQVYSDDPFTSNGVTIVTGTGSSDTDGAVDFYDGIALGSNPLSITGGGSSGVFIYDFADSNLVLGNLKISGDLEIEVSNGGITTQNYGSTTLTPATVTMTSTTNNTIDLIADGKVSFNGVGAENFTGLDINNTTAITTTGNITLNVAGTITIPTLSLTSGGSITQVASPITSATSLTVNGATVTLNDAGNAFPNVVVQGGSVGGVSLTDAVSTLTIANKTSATGNVTIVNNGATLTGNSTAGIVLGDTTGSVLSFGGNLTLTSNAAAVGTPSDTISTMAQNISVTGKTTLTTGTTASTPNNSIILGGTPSALTAWNFTGAIKATAGNGGPITLGDNSGLVLGAITTTGNFTATTNLTGSGNSGISNPSGVVSVGGTTTLAAGSSAAPSNIQVGTTAAPALLTGNIISLPSNNLTLVNALPTVLMGTSVVKGVASLTQTGNGANNAVDYYGTNVDMGTGPTLAGLSIVDTGSSLTGNVTMLISSGSTTLSNSAMAGSGTVNISTAAGAITLGAGIADTNTGTTTLTSAGAGAGISDTANSPVSIYGATSFNSDGAINLGNNTANSLGAVSLTLTGTNNNNITYTEGGGVNLAGISVGVSYSGTISIASVNSIILETSGSNLVTPIQSKLNLTATSAGGGIALSTAGANNSLASPVTITATGNSTITTSTDLNLDGVTITTGTFAASTGSSQGNIIEMPGTTIYSYAGDSFTTQGEGSSYGTITLNQSGNNFGAITIDSTNAGNDDGGNVTIKEYGGNNYAAVNTGEGSFSAMSEQSIILQTGNGGIQVEGGTTLAAPHGSITLNAHTNDFGDSAILITTTGNASITDSNGDTIIGGGTNVAGNLTINNINANGDIEDNGTTGNITVGGIAAFLEATSGNGDIFFTGANNAMGSIELKAGTDGVVFYNNTSLAIVPGTVISGAANISSGGSISITQSGPVTFASTLSLNANGNITVTNTSALFNQQVTAVVTGATSDVNLSALSLATNFNNVAPAVTTSNNATYYQAPAP